MVNDYAENLFEAMEIVAKYYYDDKKFDETIIATIVDDSGRKQGRYVVTNGTIKFDAYADSQDYKVNDVVRVTILKGDYSDKKYIVGRGIKNETSFAVTLVPPSDTILNMTGNLVSIDEDEKDKLKLIANNGNPLPNPADKNASYEAKQLWHISIDDETYNKQWQNSTYDSIVLKADFSSRLSNYSPSAGHYGLWLDVYILMSEERKTVIQKRFYLDSKDMFGDPYNFIAPSLQEIKFSITPGEKISAMELYFYQSNDFILKNNSNQELIDKTNDIWVDNICLYLGNDVTQIEDNKLVVYTHDSLLYNGNNINETPQRVLGLTWYNKNENNQYLGFSDGYINTHYDELEDYLIPKQNSDYLLSLQQNFNYPKHKQGLELAKDYEDLIQLIDQIYNLIFDSLYTTIIPKEDIDSEEVKQVFDALNDQFIQDAEDFKDYNEIWKTGFFSILSYAAAAERAEYVWNENEEGFIANDENDNWHTYRPPESTNDIIDSIKSLQVLILKYQSDRIMDWIENTLYESIRTTKNTSFTMGDYNNLRARATKILSEIDAVVTLMEAITSYSATRPNITVTIFMPMKLLLIKINQQKQNPDIILEEFKDWQAPSYTEYDNLYCIYWYKYVDSYPGDNDPLGEQNWQRITTPQRNIGLPTISENVVDKYYPIYAEQSVLTIEPDIVENTDKYKAVLIYNHSTFHSNELVFTNAIQSSAAPTLNNISIIHADNSKNAYPVYGIDGKLINASDGAKVRKVKVQYLDGWGQTSNKYLANTTVYWYIPSDSTMLRNYGYDYDTFEINTEPQIKKDGYICYYKTIGIDQTSGAVNEEDLLFPYRIKDYYVLSNKNNKIYCVIKTATQTFETFIDFSFSSFGISGTDYSLIIKPYGAQAAITPPNNENESGCDFEVFVYNRDGDQIDISGLIDESNQFEVKLDNDENIEYSIKSNFINKSLIVTVKQKQDDNNNNRGCILTITVQVKNENFEWPKPLVAQYVVPWAIKSDYYITGTTTITYDSYGSAPVYYKEPINLYNGKDELQKNGSWSIISHNENSDTQFLPTLKDNVLIPCNMYVANTAKASLVFESDSKIIYSQPLLITQNKYPSSMLNSWDGELVLNKTSETILANLIGSGKKELDNTFSGVLLGEVASADIDNGLTDAEKALRYSHTGMGLYGFHHGEQSFGFNVNGTAFIGKSGGGRIAFDGNQGYICSANWFYHLDGTKRAVSEWLGHDDKNNIVLKPGEQGMAIDLRNGYIDASNFKLTSTGIILNSNPSDDPDSENKYYLAIGNLHEEDTPTSTYIKYDSSGNLEIKVSKFELIGAYGANNLLNNTEPLQNTVDTIQTGEPKHAPTKDNINRGKDANDKQDKSAWTSPQRFGNKEINVWSALQGYGKDVYKCIGVDNVPGSTTEWDPNANNPTTTERIIYQFFNDNKMMSAGNYILTGYIWNSIGTAVTFTLGGLGNSDQKITSSSIETEGSKWTRFEYKFEITEENLPSILKITDKAKLDTSRQDEVNGKHYCNYAATYFRELKLESGSIASSWTSSVFDIEGYNKTVINAELTAFESKLNQDYIFTRLTNNNKAKGIYIDDLKTEDNLYINARYITGSLGALNVNDAGVYFNIDENVFTLAQSQSTYIQYSENKLWVGGLTHKGDFVIEDGSLKLGDVTLTAQNVTDLLDLLNKGENGV